jgi:cell division protein ZapA
MGTVSANVNILGRSYKLTISESEERYLRDAAALIDTQARMFRKQFPQRDNQDLLAMVALAKVTELIKNQDSMKFKDDELIEKLTELDTILENSLHPTQNSL